MPCKPGSSSSTSLFHKKSWSNLRKSNHSTEHSLQHSRKWSTSSSLSECSSSGSHGKTPSYDPLSLHPPLSLNTSPHVIPENDVVGHGGRENLSFKQRLHASEHIQDSPGYSPEKVYDCYFERPKSERQYVYDSNVQWPLKDWQAIPPGLADPSTPSAASSCPSTPERPNMQSRNTDWMKASDVFVKRGEWKRRGIVFHLDAEHEDMQEQHFELPEL